jgi:hypothetical protein
MKVSRKFFSFVAIKVDLPLIAPLFENGRNELLVKTSGESFGRRQTPPIREMCRLSGSGVNAATWGGIMNQIIKFAKYYLFSKDIFTKKTTVLYVIVANTVP